jgi:hypothetical protein
VFVKGNAVGGGVGLRITGAGYRWELGDGVARLFHDRVGRCVGSNGIIHGGESRHESSSECHTIVTAAGTEGP